MAAQQRGVSNPHWGSATEVARASPSLGGSRRDHGRTRPADAFCAEIVGRTLTEMGILSDEVPARWYDPGRFWSGDSLPVRSPWSYGAEVEVAPKAA